MNRNMLFAGTEHGVYVTLDGGKNWQRMRAGLPSVAVRDIQIQRRENDLVVATFGRGIYIIDDYSPLRTLRRIRQRQTASSCRLGRHASTWRRRSSARASATDSTPVRLRRSVP